jgi:ribonuclease P protein component
LRQGYRRWQRLRTADVAGLLAGGRSFKRPAFSVFLKANALELPRLGLIVPKRVFPRAVDRNRVKRVLREWFRKQANLRGCDILIRVTGKGFLVTEIASMLTRAS